MNDQMTDFIDTYVSDEKGNVYADVTSENYAQIYSGTDPKLGNWNALDADVKTAINEALKNKVGKTYDELIAESKVIADSVEGFVNTYLVEDKDNLYKEVTAANYKQIISGKTDWEKLSKDHQKAINDVLVANGGKTYEELIANVQTMESNKKAFIDEYLTGKDGTVYKTANASNYEQILSGKDTWDKLSQAEKDIINYQLLSDGGKTYELLCVLSQAMLDNKQAFIEDYLTGKDGTVYKTADASNYEQILSGKDSWDKLSQAEKDIINHELTTNGGKTYEELLALAEKLVTSPNTGDTTQTGTFALFGLVSLAGIIFLDRKRKLALKD